MNSLLFERYLLEDMLAQGKIYNPKELNEQLKHAFVRNVNLQDIFILGLTDILKPDKQQGKNFIWYHEDLRKIFTTLGYEIVEDMSMMFRLMGYNIRNSRYEDLLQGMKENGIFNWEIFEDLVSDNDLIDIIYLLSNYLGSITYINNEKSFLLAPKHYNNISLLQGTYEIGENMSLEHKNSAFISFKYSILRHIPLHSILTISEQYDKGSINPYIIVDHLLTADMQRDLQILIYDNYVQGGPNSRNVDMIRDTLRYLERCQVSITDSRSLYETLQEYSILDQAMTNRYTLMKKVVEIACDLSRPESILVPDPEEVRIIREYMKLRLICD